MFRLLVVAPNERIAHVVDGVFRELLGPGRHLRFVLGADHRFVATELKNDVEKIPEVDLLPRDLPGTRLIEVHSAQRGVLFVDQVFVKVLYPGRYRWWEVLGQATVEVVDLQQPPSPLPETDRVPEVGGGTWTDLTIGAMNAGVLKHHDEPVRLAEPGRYRIWAQSAWTMQVVSTALATLVVEPQDLLSRDQVPVRIKAGVSYRVVDPLIFAQQTDWAQQVYAALHHALRAVVSARDFDTLFADRATVDAELDAATRQHLPALGIQLEKVVVRDLILSAEVKELFHRVTLARKEAEAQAIRRREETAQTRQLANTARLLENNPVLLRMKELESLGELAGRIDKLTLVASGDLVKSVLLSDLARAGSGE